MARRRNFLNRVVGGRGSGFFVPFSLGPTWILSDMKDGLHVFVAVIVVLATRNDKGVVTLTVVMTHDRVLGRVNDVLSKAPGSFDRSFRSTIEHNTQGENTPISTTR
jgi:hypothetical protein